MEIVGAIASVGAILGGTQKALAFACSVPEIPDDWRRLKDELAALRAILNAAEPLFPPSEIFQQHTLPIRSALDRLRDIANDLQALLKRVTKETNDASSRTIIYNPKRLRWLYEDKFKKSVPSFLLRLHHEKTSLLLALAVAHRHEDPAGREAMNGSLQSIEEKFAIMTIQTQILPNLFQEVQELRSALQIGNQVNSHRRIEDLATSPADSENDDSSQILSNRRNLRSSHSSCTRFCPCRCHSNGWFSRVRCDYLNCRPKASTRQDTWHVNLGRWLSSYGVCISISASLRPRLAIGPGDIRYNLSEKVGEGFRDRIWRHFYGVHPMDTYESTTTVLEDALNNRNIILLEMLLSHWEIYFQQYGLNRRDMFHARWVREHGGLSEKGTAVVSKLISYCEVDQPFQITALHRAIRQGDMNGAGRALASDPTLVSMCDTEGDAPIHLAVARETFSVAMVAMLKGAGAELGQGNRNDVTPLMLASYLGNLEVAQWLLKQGVHVVDPNQCDGFGETALHHAVQSDKAASVAIVKLLLEVGAHPSTLNQFSGTPLHGLRICRGGYAMCKSKVELLITAGAKIDSLDKARCTALMEALVMNNSGAVGALVDSGASLKHKNQFGQTAFHFAALHPGDETLSELRRRRPFCSADVDPFCLDVDGYSPWDSFLWRLGTPLSTPTHMAIATEAVCHSFETLYLQSRNFALQRRVTTLRQIIALLHTKNSQRALRPLPMLVEQQDPKFCGGTAWRCSLSARFTFNYAAEMWRVLSMRCWSRLYC